jgi:membrane protease YdiL (CAAX protease family)
MYSNRSPRDLYQLSIGYVLILITVWTPNPYQRYLFWISFAVVVGFCLEGRLRGEPLGLSLRGFLASAWIVACAALLSFVGIYIARNMHTLHYFVGHTIFGPRAWGYLIWATLQQFILQTFLLTRLLRLFPERSTAILLAALMFSLAHIPNPLLVATTLAWGVASCALFVRYRNLYTVGIIHFLLGVTLAVSVPNDVHHHMRVGLGYYFYRSRHGGGNVTLNRGSHTPPNGR